MKNTSPQKRKIKVGDHAPDFTLSDQNGDMIALKDFIGKKVIILYFYPKDNSPGCTTQACTFRDEFETFKDHNAEIIGISSDTVVSHKEFQIRYSLPFTLLSDKKGKVRKQFGVSSSLGLIPGRVTYIIDKRGIVRHIFNSQVRVKAHVDKALEILLELESQEIKNKPLEIRI